MKYDLSDWEKRKAGLLPLLDAAAADGILPAESTPRLAEFLLGRGVGVMDGAVLLTAAAAPAADSLDTPRSAEPASTVEESEAPRFVRGFHDILITIGIVIGLCGLMGLATVYAVIPASIILAEILVRRQRLALPAVVLTIALAASSAFAVYPAVDALFAGSRDEWMPVAFGIAVSIITLLFFWRHKVPLALATGLTSCFGSLVLAAALLTAKLSGDNALFINHPRLVALFLGVYALLVVGTALKFDFADRLRLTRRSDVAFWMHLAAAPAILYTILALIYAGADGWFSASTTLVQAAVVVVAVLVLMLIGIVLDRRAFVTSGLLSFGYAFNVLLTQGGFKRVLASADTLGFLVLLIVGVLVLSLGIGWQPLRRVVVGALPDGFRDRLPPVRG